MVGVVAISAELSPQLRGKAVLPLFRDTGQRASSAKAGPEPFGGNIGIGEAGPDAREVLCVFDHLKDSGWVEDGGMVPPSLAETQSKGLGKHRHLGLIHGSYSIDLASVIPPFLGNKTDVVNFVHRNDLGHFCQLGCFLLTFVNPPLLNSLLGGFSKFEKFDLASVSPPLQSSVFHCNSLLLTSVHPPLTDGSDSELNGDGNNSGKHGDEGTGVFSNPSVVQEGHEVVDWGESVHFSGAVRRSSLADPDIVAPR